MRKVFNKVITWIAMQERLASSDYATIRVAARIRMAIVYLLVLVLAAVITFKAVLLCK